MMIIDIIAFVNILAILIVCIIVLILQKNDDHIMRSVMYLVVIIALFIPFICTNFVFVERNVEKDIVFEFELVPFKEITNLSVASDAYIFDEGKNYQYYYKNTSNDICKVILSKSKVNLCNISDNEVVRIVGYYPISITKYFTDEEKRSSSGNNLLLEMYANNSMIITNDLSKYLT